jgi:acyl-coenzyme A thioesterase PaaI-like protein
MQRVTDGIAITATTASARSLTIDEQSGHCFGCGPANPQGLHLKFEIALPPDVETVTATAHVTLTHLHEGAPGFIHGGIIATLLDEAMSKLNRPLDVLAMTRHLTVDYLLPVPSNQPLILIGRHIRREGRKLFEQAEICALDGSVLARGKGLFIVVSGKHVARRAPGLPTE